MGMYKKTILLTLTLIALPHCSASQEFKGFGIIPMQQNGSNFSYPRINTLQVVGDEIMISVDLLQSDATSTSSTSSTSSSSSASSSSSSENSFPQCTSLRMSSKKALSVSPKNSTSRTTPNQATDYKFFIRNNYSLDKSMPFYTIEHSHTFVPCTTILGRSVVQVTPSGSYLLTKNRDDLNPMVAKIDCTDRINHTPLYTLEPQANSIAEIINEKWSDDFTNTTPSGVFGYVSDANKDWLAFWDLSGEQQQVQAKTLLPKNPYFFECKSASKNNMVLCGAVHSDVKKLSQLYNHPQNKRLPFLMLLQESKVLYTHMGYLIPPYENDDLLMTWVSGIANHITSNEEVIFGTVGTCDQPEVISQESAANDEPDEKASQEDAANDRPTKNKKVHTFTYFNEGPDPSADNINAYLKACSIGEIPLNTAQSVQATISTKRKVNFASLKDILMRVFKEEILLNRDLLPSLHDRMSIALLQQKVTELEQQYTQLQQWHLVEVMQSTFDHLGNVIFAGLGINPQNQFELFYFKGNSDTLFSEVDYLGVYVSQDNSNSSDAESDS